MKLGATPFSNDDLLDDLDYGVMYLGDAGHPGNDPHQALRTALVHAHNTETDYNAQATSLCDGSIVVTWQCYAMDGEGWSVHGQRYDPLGEKLGPAFRVGAGEAALDQYNPSVTALCDGGFVVTWQSLAGLGDGGCSGIFGQRFDRLGTAMGASFVVTQDDANGHVHPTVETLCDGGFVVTWRSHHQQQGNCCMTQGRRYDAHGQPVGEAVEAWHDRQGSVWLHEHPALMSVVENNHHLTGYSLRHLLADNNAQQESHRFQPCPASERQGQGQRPCQHHLDTIGATPCCGDS